MKVTATDGTIHYFAIRPNGPVRIGVKEKK
jgi:hypothetical protein